MIAHKASLSRRLALSTLAGFGLTTAAYSMVPPALRSAEKKGFFAMHNISPGVQLYAVKDAMARDLRGTFRRLSEIGFEVLELAGFHGYEPATVKAAADEFGLEFASIHAQGQLQFDPADPLLTGDIGQLADKLRTLGVTDVVMPLMLLPGGFSPPEGEGLADYIVRSVAAFTVEDWQRNAQFLNERGAALRAEGLHLSYHNHNLEFAPVGATTGWDILLAETDPELVSIEMDVGWAAAAGIDPSAMFVKYPGRIRHLHVKDVSRSTVPNFSLQQQPAILGSGRICWKKLLDTAVASGVKGYFLEQEEAKDIDPFDMLTASMSYLRTVD